MSSGTTINFRARRAGGREKRAKWKERESTAPARVRASLNGLCGAGDALRKAECGNFGNETAVRLPRAVQVREGG